VRETRATLCRLPGGDVHPVHCSREEDPHHGLVSVFLALRLRVVLAVALSGLPRPHRGADCGSP